MRLIFCLFFCFGFMYALDVHFLKYEKNEFSPILNEKFTIPFSLQKSAVVQITVFTPDGAMVRTIKSSKVLQPGKHFLIWDGKDSENEVVADEAYNVVLKAIYSDATETIDPRKTSGGVVQKNLHPKISEDGKITYTLTQPSRILIRLGIEAGVMLRSLVNWVPRNAGKNIQPWDGYDSDHLIKVQEQKGFKIIFSAFSLADYTVLVTGGKKSYFEYAQKFLSYNSMQEKTHRLHTAKSKSISPYYVRTLFDLQDPKIDFVFPKNIQKDRDNIPVLQEDQEVRIKVIMDKRDSLRMNKVKYEITLYNDLEFISEEEMGYVPMSWIFSAHKKKGKHILSVNISSFKGHVGLKSVRYKVKK